MKSIKTVLALLVFGVTSIYGQARVPATTSNYKAPAPYVQTVNQMVDTLVLGMSTPTAQPTFDSFMGNILSGVESSFVVPAVARGERTVFQEAEQLKAFGQSYCSLHVNLSPCNDGTLDQATKIWVDKYMEWASAQPVGVYVSGGPWDVSIAGNKITVEAPVTPTLPIVGDCFPSWPPGARMCYAPGASLVNAKDGDVVTQNGKRYRINATSFLGSKTMQYSATPLD